MEAQTELMLNLKEIIEKNVQIPINRKELADDGRVYVELGPGSTIKRYIRTGAGVYRHPVLFMCKDMDEPACIEKLSMICNYLKSCRRLSNGEAYQFRKLSVSSEPHKTGRQEDGQTVYSCIVEFDIYY